MTLLTLAVLTTTLALVCAVPVALLVGRAEVWWRRRRGAGRPGDRRTVRRLGAGLTVYLGLGITGAAVVSPWAPALGDNKAHICLERDTPAELDSVTAPEAIRVEPELVGWPWGYRCTYSHHELDGAVVDEPGWGHTITGGIGAAVVLTGATTLVRTRGRDGATDPART